MGVDLLNLGCCRLRWNWEVEALVGAIAVLWVTWLRSEAVGSGGARARYTSDRVYGSL